MQVCANFGHIFGMYSRATHKNNNIHYYITCIIDTSGSMLHMHVHYTRKREILPCMAACWVPTSAIAI